MQNKLRKSASFERVCASVLNGISIVRSDTRYCIPTFFFSPSFFLIQAVFVALEAQASFLHWYGSDNPVPLCLPTMPYKSSGFRGVRAYPNDFFFFLLNASFAQAIGCVSYVVSAEADDLTFVCCFLYFAFFVQTVKCKYVTLFFFSL